MKYQRLAASLVQVDKASKSQGGLWDTTKYRQNLAFMKQMREEMAMQAQASGKWHVETVRVNNATTQWVENLRRGKVGIMETMRMGPQLRKQIITEQVAMRNSLMKIWGQGTGKLSADIYMPTSLPKSMMSLRQQVSLYSDAISKASVATVNWGKNTQWAGRQLVVGFTVPLSIAATLLSKFAVDIDEQLVRIQKVYDTFSTSGAAKEAELIKLRTDSYNNARQAIDAYGAELKGVLEVQAEFAATGVRGDELMEQTNQAVRLATLGEMEYQEATAATIAMQNAWKLSTDELADSMNFINAIENATSLSIGDFAESIPRAAAAMAGLGVSLEETGILLVAMRENGIEAAQGANALKSAVTKILNPTRQAQEAFGRFGIDIMEISKMSGGNLFEVLRILGEVMQGLGEFEKQQLIAKLFGTYQFNRVNAALNGISEAFSGTADAASQTARAVAVLNEGSGEWAASADEELGRLTGSMSGQYKIQIENMKASLAELGEAFLPLVVDVFRGINNILDAINNIPDVAKQVAIRVAAAVAIIGPVMMVAGQFGNLIGSTTKFFAGAVNNLTGGMKLLTAEQYATETAALRAKAAIDSEAISTQAFTGRVQELDNALTQLAAKSGRLTTSIGNVAGAAAAASGMAPAGIDLNRGTVFGSKGQPVDVAAMNPSNGRVYGYSFNAQDFDSKGNFIRNRGGSNGGIAINQAQISALDRQGLQYKSLDKAARSYYDTIIKGASAEDAAAAAAAKKSRSMGLLAGNILASAGAMGLMLGGTNEFIQALSLGALAAGTMGSSLVPMLKEAGGGIRSLADRAAVFAMTMDASTVKGSKFAKTLGVLKKGLMGVWTAAGPVGILAAAFTALAGAIYIADRQAAETFKKFKEFNNSATVFADVLGFDIQSGAREFNELGQEVESVDSKVRKLRDTNKQFVEQIRSMRNESPQRQMQYALGEAIAVKEQGGTADQARESAQIILNIMGNELGKEENAEKFQEEFAKLLDFSDSDAVTRKSIEFMERQAKALASNDSIRRAGIGPWSWFPSNVEIEAEFKGFMEKAIAAFDSAANSSDQREVLETVVEPWRQKLLGAFNIEKAEFSKYGVKTFEELLDYLGSGGELNEFSTSFRKAANDYEEVFSSLQGALALDSSVNTLEEVFEALNITEEVLEKTTESFISVADAASIYAKEIAMVERYGGKMNDTQKLMLLNSLRLKAGLSEVTDIAVGFSDALRNVSSVAATTGYQLDQLSFTAEQWTDVYKDAMTDTMSGIYDRAGDIWEANWQKKFNAVDANLEANQARIDSELDALEDRYDSRADALDEWWDKKIEKFENRWDRALDKEEARWDRRVEAAERAWDARINSVESEIDKLNELDDRRREIFDAEIARIKRLAEIANANIDFNVALNTGDLDEAARILTNVRADEEQIALEASRDKASDATEQRVDQLKSQIDAMKAAKDEEIKLLKATGDARIEQLKKQQQAEEKALRKRQQMAKEELESRRERDREMLESQRERYRKEAETQRAALEARQKRERASLEIELEALRAYIPRNEEEMRVHMNKIADAYGRYGVNLRKEGRRWAGHVGDTLENRIKIAATKLQNDIDWKTIAERALSEGLEATGMTLREWKKWITTGQGPGITAPSSQAGVTRGNISNPGSSISRSYQYNSNTGVTRVSGTAGRAIIRHKGGPIPGSGDVPVTAQGGEYMVQKSAVDTLGTDFMDAINSGKFGVGGGALTDLIGLQFANIAGVMRTMIRSAVNMAASGMASAGDYMQVMRGMGIDNGFSLGNLNLGALKSLAMNAGFSPSQANIMAAIAMAESAGNPRAHNPNASTGDNSYGLWQINMLGSMGPARRAQFGIASNEQLFDPTTNARAAKKIFQSQGFGAWSVYKSGAYLKFLQQAMAATGSGGTMSGGWGHPLPGAPVTSRYGMRRHPITGQYKLHDGTDLGARSGTPIRAAGSGNVLSANYAGGYGNLVLLGHGSGRKTGYAHMSQFAVAPGQAVRKGQTIGYVGSTGYSTGPHLHFMYERGNGGTFDAPGMIIPGLKTGGVSKYDNMVANLHKNETVLTAPLSKQLTEGIQNMGSGGGDTYEVHLHGIDMSRSEDVQRAVERAIDNVERRKGQRRRFGNGAS